MKAENCRLPEISGAYIERTLVRLRAVIVGAGSRKKILLDPDVPIGLKSWRVIGAVCSIFEMSWVWSDTFGKED